ncbi:hypothetical protein M2171_001202 [Bradyrhizobium japonicum USDA 38]|nr:hypothetical protein [Bradyrhizobium japonicum USDA 38]MCS3944584.1 hypothetical protein [Bradyrhizobium japonicum]
MLRQTSNEEQILDRTAEVAATIAEEGLRYVSDSTNHLQLLRQRRQTHHRCHYHRVEARTESLMWEYATAASVIVRWSSATSASDC